MHTVHGHMQTKIHTYKIKITEKNLKNWKNIQQFKTWSFLFKNKKRHSYGRLENKTQVNVFLEMGRNRAQSQSNQSKSKYQILYMTQCVQCLGFTHDILSPEDWGNSTSLALPPAIGTTCHIGSGQLRFLAAAVFDALPQFWNLQHAGVYPVTDVKPLPIAFPRFSSGMPTLPCGTKM